MARLGEAIEEIGERRRSLDHREVTPRQLDWLHAEKLAAEESFPFRVEELVLGRVDERRGEIGMGAQRVGPSRRGSGAQMGGQHAGDVRRESWIHRFDRITRSPDGPTGGIAPGKREACSEDIGSTGRCRERAESRADVDKKRRMAGRRDKCGLRRRDQMPDNNDRPVDAVERLQRRSGPLGVIGVRIVERHIGRHRRVAPLAQASADRLPTSPIVPLAVDEAEGKSSDCVWHSGESNARSAGRNAGGGLPRLWIKRSIP